MMRILGSEKNKWQAIIDRVQGDEAPASCSLSHGKIVFYAPPIPYGADPDLKFLADVLRSDEPLPPVARAWLADIFDPDVKSQFNVKSGKPGRRKAGATHNWDAAAYADLLMDCGVQADDPKAPLGRPYKWEQAMEMAAAKFNTNISDVEAALKSYRAARKAHDEIA